MVSTLKNMKFLTALALGAMTIAPQAFAQEDEEQNLPTRRETFQDWVLTCFNNDAGVEACNISQAFVQRDSNRAILRAIVRQAPGATENIMILAVPLGVDLRKGAALQISEDKGAKLTYTMCLPDGCRLQFTLNDEALDLMRTADKGQLIFGRPNQQQNIGVPVSFNGFTEAYAALLATE